jgi:hypothetical protein
MLSPIGKQGQMRSSLLPTALISQQAAVVMTAVMILFLAPREKKRKDVASESDGDFQ